jgi:oligopeptide transport system ATP-binding protein
MSEKNNNVIIVPEKEIVLEVNHLKKYFNLGRGNVLKAVDDVSFAIKEGETVGVVGESGCGKTTCARTCIGMYDKTDGQVLYRGMDVHKLHGKQKRAFAKDVQMVFQDPYASLDPRMTVFDIIGEGIDVHKLASNKNEKNERVFNVLNLVGLNKEHASRFVHEFSGGQRQRIGIARALVLEPRFIMCDEPISALDVSIQAQIVNLLVKLQQDMKLTYLFIAHDLSMVKHISNRVVVMYLGAIVEITTSDELYKEPLHPYTQALLSAIPIPDPIAGKKRKRIMLEGDVPSPVNTVTGCKFISRCKHASEKCKEQNLKLKEVSPGHFVACSLY